MHFLKTQYPEHILIYSPEYGTNGVGKFPTHLRSATWMVPDYKEHPADNSASVEYYGENSQWLVKRTSHYGFAAKGGCNNEPHNHNDVGSFVFAKNGKQILMDPGSGRYTRQYFMDEIRYSMVECSSRGHSVPMIGDTCQFFGDDARAADVTYENGVFSMNIAGAYRCEGLERIDRRFTPREDSVTLEDRYVYQGTQSITERIVTLIKPEIISDHVVKVDDVTITYDPAQCTCEINKEVTSLDKVCYFIVFRLAQGQRIFECTIR